MGQYFLLVNEDKKEFVSAWTVGGGAKFYEWLWNHHARLLPWLLRRSTETGGGDIADSAEYETLGRWAGDRILLVGDYDESRLYQTARAEYRNIGALLWAEYNRGCADTECQLSAPLEPELGSRPGLPMTHSTSLYHEQKKTHAPVDGAGDFAGSDAPLRPALGTQGGANAGDIPPAPEHRRSVSRYVRRGRAGGISRVSH